MRFAGMAHNPLIKLVLAASLLFAINSSHAAVYGGIEFPGGLPSFADKVISYDPAFSGGNIPSMPFRDPLRGLDAPDFTSALSDQGFVALGSGGQIVLEFTDNFLTGSDSDALDLHIFEIGPDVEDTFVAISKDGVGWTEIGKVFGATSSIDIDAFGFGSSDFFRFVRLTDDPSEGQTIGNTVGADIDAVGAITTVPRNDVPDSGSSALMIGLSLVGLLGLRRKLARVSA